MPADGTAVVIFKAIADANQKAGQYCNTYTITQNGIPQSSGSLACVTVAVPGTGKIGDTLFVDWNGNGQQEANEPGLPGVTVTLTLPGGGSLQLVTDAEGKYLFTGLAAGTYTVTVPTAGNSGVPSGYQISSVGGIPGTVNSLVKALAAGQEILNADWGYHPTGVGSIGDQVFDDKDADGVFDVGTDVGIPGVPVVLYFDKDGDGVIGPNDPQVGSTTTGSCPGTNCGKYLFQNLVEGIDYLVYINKNDSNLSTYFGALPYVPTTPIPQLVENLSGAYLNADFGFHETVPAGSYSIGDLVFIDANNDGVYNPADGDTPLPDVELTLYADNSGSPGAVIANTTTAINGTYLFGNLPSGNYFVAINQTSAIPANYGLRAPVTSPFAVIITTANRDDVDFPYIAIPPQIQKAVNKAAANVSDTLTYTLTPQYTGNDLLTGVQVVDGIPAGSTYKPGSVGQGGDFSTTTDKVSWYLGSTALAIDSSKTLTNSTGSTITQRGSATLSNLNAEGTQLTVGKPTGVQAGDLLIAQFGIRGSVYSSSPSNAPSATGWTFLTAGNFETGGKKGFTSIAYKVATATDALATTTSYTFDLNAVNEESRAAITAFSGVDTSSPFDVVGTWNTVGAGTGGTTNTAPGITTITDKALVIMFAALQDGPSGSSFSNWTTTSPGTLTELYDYNPPNRTKLGMVAIGAADASKAVAGNTGNGVVTNGVSKKYTSVLLALKPGTSGSYSYDAKTALSADRSLVTAGDEIQVTLTLSTDGNSAGTVTAGDLTVVGTNGADAICGAASPSEAIVNPSATFSYTCTVSAGSTPGLLTFSATPSNSDGTWATGTANTVIATPALTYQATVNSGAAIINNIGRIQSDTPALPPSDSNQVSTVIGAGIGDFVWADLNGNGVQDPGEPGLADVKVCATKNGSQPEQVSCATTDVSGKYFIGGLGIGTYTVATDPTTYPTGYVPTTATVLSVTLTSGQQFMNADFGLQPPGTLSIGDTVWLDADNDGTLDEGETPLPNITIKLYRDVATGTDPLVATVVTDANGKYLFPNLPAGTYRVEVDEVNSKVTLPYPWKNANETGPTEAPLGTAMIKTTGTVNPKTVTLTTTNLDVDFGYNWAGVVGDRVVYDPDESGAPYGSGDTGVSGVTLALVWDQNGNGVADVGEPALGVAFTDATGTYQFTNLPPGKYVVQAAGQTVENAPGSGVFGTMVPTADYGENYAVNLIANGTGGMSDLTADFGYVEAAVISGNVFWDKNLNGVLDPDETRLDDIEVTLYNDKNEIVDIPYVTKDGSYFFLVPPGKYKVVYATSQTTTLGYPIPTTILSYAVTAAAGQEVSDLNFGVANPPDPPPVADLSISKDDGKTTLRSGDTTTYTIVVTNGGPSAADNALFSDPAQYGLEKQSVTCENATPAGDAECPGSIGIGDVEAGGVAIPKLPSGGSMIFKVTAKVTAVVGDDRVYNAAFIDAPDGVTDSNPTDNSADDTDLLIAPKLSLVKSITSGDPYAAVGDSIVYGYEVENTGNATISALTVGDDKIVLPNVVSCSETTVAPGAKTNCTATYKVTQEDMDAGKVTNTAQASGKDPTDRTVSSNEDSEEATTTRSPKLSLVKSITSGSPYSQVGGEIVYGYEVENTGNVTISSLAVGDDKIVLPNVVNCTDTTLAPGAKTSCTATYKVTQEDMDAGKVTNTATASGKDPADGKVDSNSASQTAKATQSATLSLVKSITSGNPYSQVGGEIVYRYQVENTGNVTISSLTVGDDKIVLPNVVSCTDTTLAPGAKTSCTATYKVTQADLNTGKVTNTAKASGQDPTDTAVDSNEDSEEATATQSPKLSLVKTASPTTYTAVDQPISYSYVVTNTGNVTISSLMVIDDKITGTNSVSCPVSSLTAGASTTCTATYAITQADINAGSVTNTAYATGEDPDKETVTSPVSTAVVTRLVNPGTPPTVSKSFTPTVILINEFTVLRIQIGNSNSTALTLSLPLVDSLPAGLVVASPAAVNDDLGGSVGCDVNNITATAGTAKVVYEAGSKIPVGGCSITVHVSGGVKGGLYTNVIGAGDLVTDGGNNLNPTEAKLFVDPADLAVTKTLDTSGPYRVGQALTFTIVVLNKGPDPAENVLITDSFTHLSINTVSGGGCSALPCTLPNLAVDEERVITVVATITQSGTFSNTATVSAESPPDPKPDNNSSTVSGSTSATPIPAPIPALPEWAVILMGLLMLGLVWEAQRRGRHY